MAGRGTTATVALERAKIPFTVHEYEHDPRAASYGREASEALASACGGKRAVLAEVAAADAGWRSSWPRPTWSGPRARPSLASGLCGRGLRGDEA